MALVRVVAVAGQYKLQVVSQLGVQTEISLSDVDTVYKFFNCLMGNNIIDFFHEEKIKLATQLEAQHLSNKEVEDDFIRFTNSKDQILNTLKTSNEVFVQDNLALVANGGRILEEDGTLAEGVNLLGLDEFLAALV